MEYSFRFRRRLTKPPTLPPVLVAPPALVVIERFAPAKPDQLGASCDRR